MTLYHIEPVIVPPWTPEGQANHEDPQIAAFARIAETGYRIQWAENDSPRIDYFKRDKPEDFYPVAHPMNPLENTLGALIFQLAEQIQSLKGELAELKEDQWSDDAALMAEALVQQWVRDGKTGADERLALPELKKAVAETIAGYTRKIETDQTEYLARMTDLQTTLKLTEGERDVAMDEVNRLNGGLGQALEQMQAINTSVKAAAEQTQGTSDQVQQLLETANEHAKAHGYWYRRACFAESALQPFADEYEHLLGAGVEAASTNSPESVIRDEALRQAHRVLAESRKAGKPEIENLEDYVRAERQRKMTGWAARSFPDNMTVFDRAKRLLEEAAEAYWAMIHEHHMQLVVRADPDASANTVNINQLALNTAIRLISTKLGEPAGKVDQEFGGVALTLAIAAEVCGHQVAACEKQEFERVLSKPQSHWSAREAHKQGQGL